MKFKLTGTLNNDRDQMKTLKINEDKLFSNMEDLHIII